MNNEIANPHWLACSSCIHHGKNGCETAPVDFIYDKRKDAIICEDYQTIDEEEE
jgi:hypothetical protein